MLTTTHAPFIDAARSSGKLYIQQPYHLYSEENHEVWRQLYARLTPRWERYAHPRFLEGVSCLCLDPNAVPRLDDINRFLFPRSRFAAKAVSGYVPAFVFFDCLRNREFPTTITIRSKDSLDYLPEPDIFHDVAGHVPMHTDPTFADVLVRFGEVAHTAADIAMGLHDDLERLASIVRAMARFFWFTVEFGLMNTSGGFRAYGSGLLSSYGELEYALTSPHLRRVTLDLEHVIHQTFDIDHFQPLLYVADSFDHVYDLAGRLEVWMRSGKLDRVAPGEPEISEADLRSFLQPRPL